MGVTVVIVLAFQSFFGYIYHWIGLLLTVFMVGLTIGAGLITAHIKKSEGDRFLFLKLEVLIVLYSLLLFGVLYLMKEFPDIPSAQLIMLTLAIICGFLVGAQFPIANKLYLKGNIPLSQTAGTLYSTDLIGAWLGGLVVTIALVPILGILETCLIFVLLKFCSLLLFQFSKK
jgi:spermidine synthase